MEGPPPWVAEVARPPAGTLKLWGVLLNAVNSSSPLPLVARWRVLHPKSFKPINPQEVLSPAIMIEQSLGWPPKDVVGQVYASTDAKPLSGSVPSSRRAKRFDKPGGIAEPPPGNRGSSPPPSASCRPAGAGRSRRRLATILAPRPPDGYSLPTAAFPSPGSCKKASPADGAAAESSTSADFPGCAARRPSLEMTRT